MILSFKKWLETFSQETEPPIQDPVTLNGGALPIYEVPTIINPLLIKKSKLKMKK